MTITCVPVYHTCITDKISGPAISISMYKFWAPVTGQQRSLLIFRWHFKYNLQANMTTSRQYQEFVELRQWCLAHRRCCITSAQISSSIAIFYSIMSRRFSRYIYALIIQSCPGFIPGLNVPYHIGWHFCGNMVKANRGLHLSHYRTVSTVITDCKLSSFMKTGMHFCVNGIIAKYCIQYFLLWLEILWGNREKKVLSGLYRITISNSWHE